MLEFSLDDLEVQRGFKKLLQKTPELSRRVLSFMSEAVVNRSVESHLSGQTLKRQSGTLAKSINYKMQGDFTSVVGTNVKYAAIHEFGGVIEPKNALALTFKVADTWVTTSRVIMPKRPFLAPALQWVMDNEASKIFNKQCQMWIDKEWQT